VNRDDPPLRCRRSAKIVTGYLESEKIETALKPPDAPQIVITF
jgi:hypothetical protein